MCVALFIGRNRYASFSGKLFILLLGLAMGLVACNPVSEGEAAAPVNTPPSTPSASPEPTATLEPTITPQPTEELKYAVNGSGNSMVEEAHARLQNQGMQVFLVIVSNQSTGVEGEIYRDLRRRNFRSTTGPDEGIDMRGEFCYPDCVFVPLEAVNALSVEAWMDVLQHEYRHIVQVRNNPNMAQDFRDSNGMFTPYAAFAEACADYGLDVAPLYRAQERMDYLKNVVGADQQGLIELACRGHISAFQKLFDLYNEKVGRHSAFQDLFPAYS